MKHNKFLRYFLFLFSVFTIPSFSFGQYFATSYGTATSSEHRAFMNSQRVEVSKRAALWRVPSDIVNVVASVQSNAGQDAGFNYGKVKSMPHLTKYPKFAQRTSAGLVRCEKASRGLEAIAITLRKIRDNNNGISSDREWLRVLFVDGELSNKRSEAKVAYEVISGKAFPFKVELNPVNRTRENPVSSTFSIGRKSVNNSMYVNQPSSSVNRGSDCNQLTAENTNLKSQLQIAQNDKLRLEQEKSILINDVNRLKQENMRLSANPEKSNKARYKETVAVNSQMYDKNTNVTSGVILFCA